MAKKKGSREQHRQTSECEGSARWQEEPAPFLGRSGGVRPQGQQVEEVAALRIGHSRLRNLRDRP
jgi:hypothetical protein